MLQVGDGLIRICNDPVTVYQHGDGLRPRHLLEFCTPLPGGRDVHYLIVGAELGELGANAVGEGAPLSLIKSHRPRASLRSASPIVYWGLYCRIPAMVPRS